MPMTLRVLAGLRQGVERLRRMTLRCYRGVMVAGDFTADVLPWVVFGGIALIVVVWQVITRVFTNTRAGRRAAHLLDAGGFG